MPKHAYTNNNYCFQGREEAEQTNVKSETTYWATFQHFSQTGEGGWVEGGLPVPQGIMNHLFFSHRIFVITCEQISPGAETTISSRCFITEKKKTMRSQRVRSRENKV